MGKSIFLIGSDHCYNSSIDLSRSAVATGKSFDRSSWRIFKKIMYTRVWVNTTKRARQFKQGDAYGIAHRLHCHNHSKHMPGAQ